MECLPMPTAPELKTSPFLASPQTTHKDDETDVSALIARLTGEVNQIACEKTKSIQQITNQMKMLALNALIESSRVGAQGAGFAVVAQEVRALAQRSAEAAKEIKALISSSNEQVQLGAKLVNQTGGALGKVVGQFGEISRLVTEIASSANEQASGLNEVNVAVNQMDRFTQQNAAMVEESTAASHAIRAETERLKAKVSVFRVATDAAQSRSEAA